MMPEMSGPAFVLEVHADGVSAAPVISLTSDFSFDREAFTALNPLAVLGKPLDVAELAFEIARWLALARSQCAA